MLVKNLKVFNNMCFRIGSSKGWKHFKPRPQNSILVVLRFFFSKFLISIPVSLIWEFTHQGGFICILQFFFSLVHDRSNWTHDNTTWCSNWFEKTWAMWFKNNRTHVTVLFDQGSAKTNHSHFSKESWKLYTEGLNCLNWPQKNGQNAVHWNWPSS